MNSSLFWDITACSQLKVNRCFGGACRLSLHGRRISQGRKQMESRALFVWLCLISAIKLSSCLPYSSTQKMEKERSSETSVDFGRTTRLYMQGDRTLHCCKFVECVLQDFSAYNLLIFPINRKRPTRRYYVKTWPRIDTKHSYYDGSKGTVFLIHGYMSTGNDTWLEDMKNAYLNNVSDTSRSSATKEHNTEHNICYLPGQI
jgi:hypothetical protein